MRRQFSIGSKLGIKLLAVALICLPIACEDDKPRSRDDLFTEQRELPKLFMTAKTHKRIEAPASRNIFIDEGTGETAWPAAECHAPNCPGREGDTLYLFPDINPAMHAKPDGTIAPGTPPEGNNGGKPAGFCPKCWKAFNLANAGQDKQREYNLYVKPHVLPETAKRMAELEQERRDRRNRRP